MNRFSLILLSAVTFLSVTAFTYQQEKPLVPDDEKYKVIKVNGQIQIKKTGKNLAQGDEFLANMPLDFKTADSRAAVISPSKGRFVLTASNSSNGSNLVPAMNSIATRSGALLNMIDLQNAFVDNYVIIDEVRLKIGKDAFPMDSNHFFYVEYDYNGESIPKMLPYSNDTLIISLSEIFKIDGAPVENPYSTEFRLHYRTDDTDVNQFISSFKVVMPKAKDLKEEVKIILDEMTKKKDKEKFEEVLSYINEYYGKPDKDNVKSFLTANFDLKLKN